MICMPTGSPSGLIPAGIDADGWPVKLVKYVIHQPINRFTGSPLMDSGPSVLPSVAFSTGMQARVGEISRS